MAKNIKTRDEIQAKIRLLVTSSDEQIAAMYECDIADAVDVRENQADNCAADIEAAGLDESSFQWNF